MFGNQLVWKSTFTATLGDYRSKVQVIYGNPEPQCASQMREIPPTPKIEFVGLGAGSPQLSSVNSSLVKHHDDSFVRPFDYKQAVNANIVDAGFDSEEQLQITRRPVHFEENWAVYMGTAAPTNGVEHKYTTHQKIIMQ